jgi:hypothetical protein
MVGIAKKLTRPHPKPISRTVSWSTVQLPTALLGTPATRSTSAQPAIDRRRRAITCQPVAGVTGRDSRVSATRPATPTATAVTMTLRQ